ncbi:patatin-like phospholipase family protein [Pseudomonas sp. BGr12]|uniref:patatin-like phospholipase family protein n=1 Tax=unclassified Pseudomonas TaxID=196821 RepID=UPI00177F21AC|nr:MULTISPECIES: patatin-like phospholipase family protein [unclassified Pseudomonas]MBD9499816.1 patatin-like phospholipase family protein [Pseudomonas sp. PDM17]MBD9575443.1 patatin-like phospholipase family protein [Pseudomonas sp. PDM23]MBD9669615.1 patatin-like phospholipase family protein [Pseudomonas sp. PDM21]MDL2427011.1 patatin-like phospholipase family protein [Pseudomonas sp. BJa5]
MRRLLFALLLLLPLGALAANTPPKIGLVLSGGAARGLAHIGVLKALDEQGIHVDAIAGTSMGAVIGGLYAAGYTPRELEQLALGLDWKQALSDSPPRVDVPFRRKQDDRDFLVKQKLSFRDDGTLGLPLGAIQGQNLSMLLESLLVHTSDTRNFDQLAIPFRAVATDISTGEKVVFSKGHLPQAIRASMSIPAVFAPVDVNGKLLVDGGMVDNIPVDVARQMGVDVVIVVDIGNPLLDRKQLTTVVDMLNQSVTLMTRKNSEAQLATLKSSDILVQPPLSGYSSTDFGRVPQLIDAGYRATSILAPRLATLRKPADAEAVALTEARAPGERQPVIDRIEVENNSKVSDDVILHYIRQPLGEHLDLERLQRDMSTLYGLDYFDQVQYRVVHNKPGADGKSDNVLVIHAYGKRGGTDYLRLGLNLSDDLRGDSTFNVGGSYRMNGINRLGAEWLTRLQIGDRQELYSEFYQPLDVGSRYFVAPYVFNEAQNVEATDNDDPIAEYRLERYGYGLNLGRQIANNGEFRLGVAQAFGKADVRVGEQDLPDFHFTEGYAQLQYSFDTMDNVDFPREGENIQTSFREHTPSLGDDDRYRQWEFQLDKALSSGPNTWVLGGGYGRTLDDADVVVSSFLLGGARQLSGYRQDALAGQNYSLGRVIYYRRMTERSFLPLDFPFYLGGSLERGRVWNNDNSYDTGYVNAGSILMGFETPLGPLSFSYGLNDASEHAVYINLGRNF